MIALKNLTEYSGRDLAQFKHHCDITIRFEPNSVKPYTAYFGSMPALAGPGTSRHSALDNITNWISRLTYLAVGYVGQIRFVLYSYEDHNAYEMWGACAQDSDTVIAHIEAAEKKHVMLDICMDVIEHLSERLKARSIDPQQNSVRSEFESCGIGEFGAEEDGLVHHSSFPINHQQGDDEPIPMPQATEEPVDLNETVDMDLPQDPTTTTSLLDKLNEE